MNGGKLPQPFTWVIVQVWRASGEDWHHLWKEYEKDEESLCPYLAIQAFQSNWRESTFICINLWLLGRLFIDYSFQPASLSEIIYRKRKPTTPTQIFFKYHCTVSVKWYAGTPFKNWVGYVSYLKLIQYVGCSRRCNSQSTDLTFVSFNGSD